jgi:hypothetical protein
MCQIDVLCPVFIIIQNCTSCNMHIRNIKHTSKSSLLTRVEAGVEYLHRDPARRKRRRNGTKKGRAIA